MKIYKKRSTGFLGKSIATLKRYIKETEEMISYIRGRNKRIFQLFEYAKEQVKSTMPESIYDALITEIFYDKKIISSVVLRVNPSSPAYHYSMFVEFGTGARGGDESMVEGSRHAFAASIGWTYDINQHIDYGWTYFDKKQNKFFQTQGQAPSGYMYRMYLVIKKYVAAHKTNARWYEVSFGVDRKKSPYIRIKKLPLQRKKRTII